MSKSDPYGQLDSELVKLAKKYIDILPRQEIGIACPNDSCSVDLFRSPKGAVFCHLHGLKMVDGSRKLKLHEVLYDISTAAKMLATQLEEKG